VLVPCAVVFDNVTVGSPTGAVLGLAVPLDEPALRGVVVVVVVVVVVELARVVVVVVVTTGVATGVGAAVTPLVGVGAGVVERTSVLRGVGAAVARLVGDRVGVLQQQQQPQLLVKVSQRHRLSNAGASTKLEQDVPSWGLGWEPCW
jgi:hypothetical protein